MRFRKWGELRMRYIGGAPLIGGVDIPFPGVWGNIVVSVKSMSEIRFFDNFDLIFPYMVVL